MIDAKDLADLQAAQEELFDKTCEVKRAVQARTSLGGTSESFGKVHDYPCRLAPAQAPQEYIAAGRLSGGRTWWVTFAHDADVLAGDQLVIGGLTVNVVGSQAGESYLTALRTLCEEPS